MGLVDYALSLIKTGIQQSRTVSKTPIIIFTIVTFLGITVVFKNKSKKKNLPPGPKGIPFIGSLSLFRLIGLLFIYFQHSSFRNE